MSDAPTTAGDGSRTPKAKSSKSLWARIKLFFRQIIGELRKVVRPTRKELWNLFITVLVFVAIIMAIVALLDVMFGELAFLIFG